MKEESNNERLLSLFKVKKYTKEEIKFYEEKAINNWEEEVEKAKKAFKDVEFVKEVKEVLEIFPGGEVEAYIWLNDKFMDSDTPYELIQKGEKDRVVEEVKYLKRRIDGTFT